MPMNFCIILFVLAILRDSCVKSAEVVLMEQMGYSYVFPAAIGGVAYSRMIVSTDFE